MKLQHVLGTVLILTALSSTAARAQDGPTEFLQVASASRFHGSQDPEGADLFSSKGLFARFYAGYDYSFLDDLVNGIQQTGAYYKNSGGVTVGTSTDRSGVVLGTEWGQRLNGGGEVSLAAEVVSSQADSFGQSNASGFGGETIGPNLLDATVRYSFDVIRGPGSRTSLSLGAGWYHAVVDFNDSFSQGVTAEPEIQGALTGDTLGGTVGLKEQLQVGEGFVLNLSVNGRYARFGQVVASDLSGYAARIGATGPYTLAMVNLSGYWAIEPLPSQQLLAYESTGQARPAVVDYSGIDGEVSFGFLF